MQLKLLDFFTDSNAFEKLEELKAMDITCDAIISYANRHADELEKLAIKEPNRERKAELLKWHIYAGRSRQMLPKQFMKCFSTTGLYIWES